MKIVNWLVSLSLCMMSATTFAQTATFSRTTAAGGSAALYDNFNHKFLDPLR
jgi:hypothetical protein